MCFSIAHFRLAQLIHLVIYLLIVHGFLRYFKQNLCDGNLPNPTGLLPIFHDKPSYMHTAKSRLSLIKNSRDIHAYIHNYLSNVAIHMPCVNMHLSLIAIGKHCTGLIAFSCLCSKIKR